MEQHQADPGLSADTLAFGELDLHGEGEELDELGAAMDQQAPYQPHHAEGELDIATQDEGEEDDEEAEDAASVAGDAAARPDTAIPGPVQDQEGAILQEEGGLPEVQSQDLADSNDEDAAGSQLATMASLAMENLSMLSTTSSVPGDARSSGGGKGQQTDHGKAADTPGNGEDATWRSHPKHYLILTSSGKPVYTYHGDADALAGLMALITALVSVVQDQGDKLQHLITGGGTLVVMITRGPLILVAASRCGEAVEVLQRQLELLYRQILLIVTTGVERILLRNPAYDVRTLLGGVGAVLTSLIQRMHSDASYLLHGLQPVALNPTDQATFQTALAEAVKSSGAFYGALLVSSGGYVVAEQRGTTASGKPLPALDAWDVMLLENFVACNSSIRLQHGEAFCPVCLPGYNPAAFLHAYIHFLTEAGSPKHDAALASSAGELDVDDGAGAVSNQSRTSTAAPGVYLVLLSPTSDSFHSLSSARQALEQQLHARGQLQRLQDSLQPHQGSAWVTIEQLPPAAGGGKFGCTPLWHFMARFIARRQVVSLRFTEPYTTSAACQALAASYGRLHSMVHDVTPGSRPNKLVWVCTEQQVMLATTDAEVELYMVLDPLCDKPTAQRCAEQLRKHIGTTAFLQRP